MDDRSKTQCLEEAMGMGEKGGGGGGGGRGCSGLGTLSGGGGGEGGKGRREAGVDGREHAVQEWALQLPAKSRA